MDIIIINDMFTSLITRRCESPNRVVHESAGAGVVKRFRDRKVELRQCLSLHLIDKVSSLLFLCLFH